MYLANFGNLERTVNTPMEFEGIPLEATVYLTSVNYQPEETTIGQTVDTRSVVIGAKHSIILKFTA